MRVIKILLCGLLMALPVLAEESDDRQTATSLHYVSHELDTRQDKLTTGQDKALTYTNTAGGVGQRTVKENLNGGTTDTSLPQVNAVNAGLNQKQNDIAPINDHTAVTYTNNVGTIGQKGIYQDTGTYATQTDNLIDAKTFNAALKNALDSEFVCADRPDAYAPGTTNCWLWQIHEGIRIPYVSATGTVVQNGTPTPTNPIYPTFYRQGDMVLRKIDDTYYDSYDATTHKITRRVGVKVLDGTETFTISSSGAMITQIPDVAVGATNNPINTHFALEESPTSIDVGKQRFGASGTQIYSANYYMKPLTTMTVSAFKQWLADQYAAGTPVTVYYPLATPVEEDWPETTYNSNIYIPQNQ